MTAALILIVGFIGGLALLLVKALILDEVRGGLRELTRARLQRAINELPDVLREQYATEWEAELEAVRERPFTAWRFVRGVSSDITALVEAVQPDAECLHADAYRAPKQAFDDAPASTDDGSRFAGLLAIGIAISMPAIVFDWRVMTALGGLLTLFAGARVTGSIVAEVVRLPRR